MSQEKYIGMDVHQATVSAAVRDRNGNLLMECILETKADTLLEFVQGLHGTLSLAFEEGTLAAWLHDLLKPHVNRVVVCDSPHRKRSAFPMISTKAKAVSAPTPGWVIRPGPASRVDVRLVGGPHNKDQARKRPDRTFFAFPKILVCQVFSNSYRRRIKSEYATILPSWRAIRISARTKRSGPATT